MEETYTTRAIILNRYPFREHDSKAAIYSLDRGKLELIARGTKKLSSKLAGHLEPISLSKIMVVRGKQYDYVGSAISENCFLNIKSDLEKLQYAGQAINVFGKLIKEEQADENIFTLIEEYINLLDKAEFEAHNIELFYHFFVLKLLSLLGYTPELYNCVICKNKLKEPNGNLFDVAKGGVICANCSKKSPTSPPTPLLIRKGEINCLKDCLTISENCIKILRLVIDKELSQLISLDINNESKKETCKVINSFLDYR
ncbi:MAG: DNA repair protein RecO [Patescibacteria group bacterium]